MRLPLLRPSIQASLVCSLLVAGCSDATQASPSPPTGPPWLAISANPRSGSPDFEEAVDLARSAGANAYFRSFLCCALESSAGSLDVSVVKDNVDYLGKRRGLALLIGIQVINTTRKETPDDLAAASFDSPQTKARFHALIDQLKPVIDGHVRYLSIGNEVDVYLSAQPKEWAAYAAFYADAVAYVHSTLPGRLVGVTTTFTGATGATAEYVAALNRFSDVVVLSYYPLDASFRPRAPATAAQDLALMLSHAQGKPVVLQEVGYPSAKQLGSSEGTQADFVSKVLATWSAIDRDRMPFLNLFSLHDFSANTCGDLASYYGLLNADFKAYLCSLGLRHADGTPKAAWQALLVAPHRSH